MSLKKLINYIHPIWRTREEMAKKKRPKQPKVVKNVSFTLFSQPIAIRNQPNYLQSKGFYEKKKNNNGTSVKSNKWLPHKITSS